jgi:hypothetical protein
VCSSDLQFSIDPISIPGPPCQMDLSCIEIQRSILLRVLLSYQKIRYLLASRRFTAQLSDTERVKGQLSPESVFRGIERRTEAPTTTDSSRRYGPCATSSSGRGSVVRRINLSVNRLRTGWS